MTSYVVQVVVEPDEDVWRAYVPDLESRGAATWGHTRDEALRNIQEVAQMVIEELVEEQVPLPESVHVSSGETFRIGTLRGIVEIQARWSERDLRRLGLLER